MKDAEDDIPDSDIDAVDWDSLTDERAVEFGEGLRAHQRSLASVDRARAGRNQLASLAIAQGAVSVALAVTGSSATRSIASLVFLTTVYLAAAALAARRAKSGSKSSRKRLLKSLEQLPKLDQTDEE